MNSAVQTIRVNPSARRKDFDPTLFENISWSNAPFRTHQEIAAALHDKSPYTITVNFRRPRLEYKRIINNSRFIRE